MEDANTGMKTSLDTPSRRRTARNKGIGEEVVKI